MKEIYNNIISIINDNLDKVLCEIKENLQNQILIIDWNEKYGFNFDKNTQIKDRDFIRLNKYYYLSYFKNAQDEKENGYGRYISWSDDDRQPLDEWLLTFSFPTGAYFFDQDYPTEIFKDFWNELKTYNPKYLDTTNNNMYFSLENAGKILNNYKDIINKYYEINREDSKKRKILKLQKELDNLTSK